jgi:hypothetical protein
MVEERGQKRNLAPKFTKGYSHIPQLREKLRWLYGYHPIVKTQYQLAKELNISPGTLSTWLTGVSYKDAVSVAPQNPDCIPTKHHRAFMDVWGLPAAVLEMEDLTEFKNALATFESGRGPWEKLVRGFPDDSTLEIVVNGEKGLIDPDDKADEGVLQLVAGDEIMLRVPNPDLRYAALLMQDRFGWASLRPNPRWTTTEADAVLVFPRQHDGAAPRFAELDSVAGMHRVLAIFTDEPLPPPVLDILLAQPIDLNGLNHMANALQARLAGGPSRLRVISRRFLVSPARRRKSRSIASAAPMVP